MDAHESAATRGNWKRLACFWWGHENIGTVDLLDRGYRVVCLRCRGSSTSREVRIAVEPADG